MLELKEKDIEKNDENDEKVVNKKARQILPPLFIYNIENEIDLIEKISIDNFVNTDKYSFLKFF